MKYKVRYWNRDEHSLDAPFIDTGLIPDGFDQVWDEERGSYTLRKKYKTGDKPIDDD